MAVLVGAEASRTPSLPAGVGVGMLALLVTNSPQVPAGFSTVARHNTLLSAVGWASAFGETVTAAVFSRVLTAADVATGVAVSLPQDRQGVFVVFPAGCVPGLVRTGSRSVTAVAGAHALVVVLPATSGGGLSWAPQLTASGLGWMGTVAVASSVGYTPAPLAAAGVVSAPAGTGVAVEVLPPPIPAPPVLYRPAAGADVSVEGSVTFGWVTPYPASAYRLRVQTEAGWQWRSAATGAFTGSETSNTSADSQVAVPGSLLAPANTTRAWQVSSQRATDGTWSAYSDTSTLVPVSRPVVAVTAPTGTVTGSLTPLVAWTATFSRPSSTQTAYRVTVTRDAATVYDSGWTPGPATEVRLPADAGWEQGTHTVHVEVEQTGGLRSVPATRTFTMTWTAPATPVVTTTPTYEGITVTATGLVPGNLVEVERSSPTGWIRLDARTALAATESHIDVTVRRDEPATYRVRQSGDLSGQPLPSPWGTSTETTWTSRPGSAWCYVWDADAPATTWQRVYLTNLGEVRHPQVIGKHYTLGTAVAGTQPVARILRGTARAPEGTLTLEAFSTAAVDDIEGLLLRATVIGIRLPHQRDLDTRTFPPGTILHVARENEVALAVLRNSAARRVELAWVGQDRPSPSGAVPVTPQPHPIVAS